MLLIPCPWCGPRNQVEFTYGGDATKRRPSPDAPAAAWLDYVYLRDNPCGPHDELLHSAGCRSWFKVRRDTSTHDILASVPIGAEPPERHGDAIPLGAGGIVDRTDAAFRVRRQAAWDTRATLASALLGNGVHLVGRSFKYHRPRGIFSAGAEAERAGAARARVRTEPNR
jgi:heterotetrameric sarcosine oxidase delta subunit